MKLHWVIVLLLVGPGLAHAQAFRGGMGASRAPSWGGAGANSPSAQGMQNSIPGGSQAAPGIQIHGGGGQITSQSSSRGHPHGGATGWPIRPPVFFAPVRSWQVFPTQVWPRVNAWYPRNPGVLIIEVPSFVGTTVTTQAVTGSGWTDQPLGENPPANADLRAPGQLAPFDPTPQEVVERMLALARVKKSDVLYDLGSGDGRVVITAAKKYGAKAVGFEIDPGLVKLARENAHKQGVEKLVEFRQQDFMTADLSPASVVTLYLSYDGNLALRPRLVNQLKSGARVVSYTFDMGDWQPKVTENYRDAGGESHMLYYWEIAGLMAYSDSSR
jgi:hypothetical protein